MLETNNPNSEINLNLKMPSEQLESDFSIKDLVLTIYRARKVFFLWCCIGLIAGSLAAGAYYMKGSGGEKANKVSNTLTLNYPGAESALFPNGTDFNTEFFYDMQLWENALKTVGLTETLPADAMNEINITKYALKLDANGTPVEESIQDSMLVNTHFILTASTSNEVFSNDGIKEEFLRALCDEFKNSIDSRYFTEGNIGLLYNQNIKTWDSITLPIQWNEFSYEENFTFLSERYTDLIGHLEWLYSVDPSYKSSKDMNFNDYVAELIDVRDGDIRQWIGKTKENIYIRNVDRFRNEYQLQIDSIKLDYDYFLDLVSSYNDLLSSFQQKDTSQGAIVSDAVNILNDAKKYANDAANLKKTIAQMEYNIRVLETNEALIRSNSREAETVLTSFIDGLEETQNELTSVILDYYKWTNKKNAETSVIYTTPVTVVTTTGGVSTTRLLMIFAGLTFIGFAIGFCAAFVKKYLPEKKK